MPFLRPLSVTAPKVDRNLRWPVDGLAYVAAFMGPISAGPLVGILIRDWRAVAIGLPMGIAITFLNAWLSDRFLDPCVARYQKYLQKIVPRILINIVAFAWAFFISALAMYLPVLILGRALLDEIH